LYNVTEEIKNELSTRGESQEVEQKEMSEKYDGPRKMGKSYCEKTPCKDMGFSQKASCRPYKDCYK
jgi:hypothetical protein